MTLKCLHPSPSSSNLFPLNYNNLSVHDNLKKTAGDPGAVEMFAAINQTQGMDENYRH